MWWLSNFIYLHVSETLTALLVISWYFLYPCSCRISRPRWDALVESFTPSNEPENLGISACGCIYSHSVKKLCFLGYLGIHSYMECVHSSHTMILQWYIYILHTLYEVSKIPPINSSQGLYLWRFWIRWSVLWYIVMCHLRYPWTIRWTR